MDNTRSIDFTTLSLRDALDLATLIEEEAKERYGEFVEQMELHHNPDAATFFRFMLKVESIHEGKLAARRRELFGDAPRTVTREMIFDIEAPDYGEARASMSVRQALESAMVSEQKAHAFFVDALPRLRDPEARALFTELRDEELEHQHLVQKQLAKLGPDDVWGDEFADDPIAQ